MLLILFYIENVLTSSCNRIRGEHGEISSQHPYSGGENWCIWVKSQCQAGLILTVNQLELTNCTTDVLTISTKQDTINFCQGEVRIPEQHFPDREFILEFKSGKMSGDYGFDVAWRCSIKEEKQKAASVSIERNLKVPKTFEALVLKQFDDIIEENKESIKKANRVQAVRNSFERMCRDIEKATNRKDRERQCADLSKGKEFIQSKLSEQSPVSPIDALQTF
ncbi:Oidioi.mRNA.OKI2018_I69.XSR.g16110.t1.cds [Oikopleura dioica]|uniref:Oidioi.mRNA.OKI2018_I69.XSR.g16110.t1.cds n=1 Tax=Oikopleura dioica TaxID=34765 RepID=A0ABN7SK45_OIKDI|nr:Oidioi.mRNA.OKI2018_I69.XSR.g16110.t1.cds [Oikopleura dioica]